MRGRELVHFVGPTTRDHRRGVWYQRCRLGGGVVRNVSQVDLSVSGPVLAGTLRMVG
jgi:hypothetical protein